MNEMENLKFVGEVEKFPILYNYKLPGYSRKDLTQKAWCEVGKAAQMTANDAKEKWRNLRTVFIRHMKPCGSGSNKKKPYYLAEAMQFTLPFVKTLNISPSQNLLDIPKHEKVASLPPSPPQFSPTPSTSSIPSLHESVQSEKPSQSISNSCPKTTSNRKRDAKSDQVDEEYFKVKMSKMSATSSQNEEKKEAIKMFLLSLLPELNEMNDEQIKIFKRRTFLTIDDIMNQYSSITTFPLESEYSHSRAS